MERKELFLQELQMLTGVVTNDYDYLVYLLLKNSGLSKNDTIKVTKFEEVKVPVDKIDNLEDWFSQLEQIDIE